MSPELAAAPAVRERPIIFSAPMVRAILAGQKTQTRRPVKNLRIRLRHEVASDLPRFVRERAACAPGVYPAEMNQHGAVSIVTPAGGRLGIKPAEFDFLCPYADGHTYLRKHPDGRMEWTIQTTGDRLWVREAWAPRTLGKWKTLEKAMKPLYRADEDRPEWKNIWRSPMFMPRWASRLVLEVTEVRVQRVQDITEEDAIAEGIEPFGAISPDQKMPVTGERFGDSPHRCTFMCRWDEMYESGPFEWRANPWVWAISFRRVA